MKQDNGLKLFQDKKQLLNIKREDGPNKFQDKLQEPIIMQSNI